jgi:hypothetical protein
MKRATRQHLTSIQLCVKGALLQVRPLPYLSRVLPIHSPVSASDQEMRQLQRLWWSGITPHPIVDVFVVPAAYLSITSDNAKQKRTKTKGTSQILSLTD